VASLVALLVNAGCGSSFTVPRRERPRYTALDLIASLWSQLDAQDVEHLLDREAKHEIYGQSLEQARNAARSLRSRRFQRPCIGFGSLQARQVSLDERLVLASVQMTPE